MYVIRRLALRKANPDPGEKPMRASKTLKKLRSGRCARVCGMGHYLPFYIRYAAHFRFDVIWLDLEHRAMSQREVQSILAMCQQHDIDCMVREVLRRCPTLGIKVHYRLDGRWLDLEDMTQETRIACQCSSRRAWFLSS